MTNHREVNLSIAFAGFWIQHDGVALDVERARALLALYPVNADDGVLEKVRPDDLVLAAVCPHSHVFPQRGVAEESRGAVVVAEELTVATAGAVRVNLD